jgi:hypothetical protein
LIEAYMRALAILLVVCGHVASAHASASAGAPDEQRLTLGGITIGRSEASVIAVLGNPQRRTEEPYSFLPVTLSYPGLEIFLDEQGVGGVLSTSKHFCTPAKICPGMTLAEVARAYGASAAYERDGRVFRDYLPEDGCWLRIEFQADVAVAVETTCAP